MDLVSPQKIRHTIEMEITSYYEWSFDKKISDLLPKEKMISRIKDIYDKININDKNLIPLKKYISTNYKYLNNEKIPVNSMIDKNGFIKYGNSAMEFKEARERGVNFIVHSSSYSRMLSSIVYASIKDFLAENPLTKNNPVASSFMKMGQDFLNNLPGMQGNFDATITDFMRNSLSGRIQQSEKLIREEMDSGKNTDELLRELWDFLGTIKLSEINELIPEKEVINFASGIPDAVSFMKANGQAEKMAIFHVEEFYKIYGDIPLGKIYEEWGISGIGYLSEVISSILDNESFRDYYRNRLLSRLSGFYSSEAVQKLLS